jgi:hypothetical protein
MVVVTVYNAYRAVQPNESQYMQLKSEQIKDKILRRLKAI